MIRRFAGLLFYGLAAVVALPGFYLLAMSFAAVEAIGAALLTLCTAAFLAFIVWYLTAP